MFPEYEYRILMKIISNEKSFQFNWIFGNYFNLTRAPKPEIPGSNPGRHTLLTTYFKDP